MIAILGFKKKDSPKMQCICDDCGAILEYTKEDIRTYFEGSCHLQTWVTCPNCMSYVFLRREC